MDSLLSKALDVVGLGPGEDGTEVPLPEISDTVVLPPASSAMKEARKKLAERERDGLAGLKEQIKEAEAEAAEEQKVIDAAIYDVETELANGETRESLSARKIAAQVASEILEVKERDIANLKAKLEMKKKELNFRSSRLIGWLQQTEVSTRAYQISLITQADRLHPERFARAYRLLQSLEREATELLGEDLAKEVIASITTNPIEPTLQGCLLAQMHPRERKAIEDELENNKDKGAK